jgi:hypothetical protein
MAELCQKDAPPEPRVKVDETEVIDLTLNDDDDHLETIAATCKAPSDADLSFFAEDDSRMTLSELLGCLTVGEMTAVAKELKLKTPQAVSWIQPSHPRRSHWCIFTRIAPQSYRRHPTIFVDARRSAFSCRIS